MQQEYDKYTSEDHQVWSILYNRMMEILPKYATKSYLNGMGKVGFESHRIPDFKECNVKLMEITGWTIYAVPGLIENKGFFELAEKFSK
jgi:phenylalanine-4-hydroxylase